MAKFVFVPILHPAPNWATPVSEYIILWHGCTEGDKDSILKGVDPTKCRARTDFGRGFYTTTLPQQAAQWAWIRSLRAISRKLSHSHPVVLRFRVARDALAKSESLHFVLGNFNNSDYWSFVQHCRQGNDHHRANRKPWYDIVSGPVAAMWRQRVAMLDADQISFHTDRAVQLLNDAIRSGNADDFSWQRVP